MQLVITLVQVLLGVGAVFALYRLVRGPRLADRANALDVLLLLLASGVAANEAQQGGEVFTPVLIVVALMAFLATATIARYAEWREEEES